jgi:hypothetical protein
MKAKAAIPAPTIEDSDKIEVSEQSEATPRRRSAARDYLNARISDEEFQSWVQGLIAARNNKASNNKALSVMEQPTKTPTTMNFPVYPTEAVNMSGRRLSQIFSTREMPTGTRPALL